jgi:hypothetical protein
MNAIIHGELKVHDALASPEETGEMAKSQIANYPAKSSLTAVPFDPLTGEAIQPVFLGVGYDAGSHLPISAPLDSVPISHQEKRGRSRRASKVGLTGSSGGARSNGGSRRNSWVAENDAARAAQLHNSSSDQSSERTMVEMLSPSATSDIGAGLVSAEESGIPFASSEAAAQYNRMLRRASWPILMAGDPTLTAATHHVEAAQPSVQRVASTSYHATPVTTPRTSARQLHHGDHPDGVHFDTSALYAAVPTSSATLTVPASLPATSPLLNVLLLGDSTCGLGSALDEFAGRNRGLGVTCKTRKIIAPGTTDVTYRLRCWHTPGTPDDTHRPISSLLRQIHCIFLLYDASSPASLHVVEKWWRVLENHWRDHAEDRRSPILLMGNTATLVAQELTQRSASDESKGDKSTSTSAAVAPLDVAPDLPLASAASSLLAQMRSSSSSLHLTHPISSLTIDAHRWRSRYLAFETAVGMAKDCGIGAQGSCAGNSANSSRTTSPVREGDEAAAATASGSPQVVQLATWEESQEELP